MEIRHFRQTLAKTSPDMARRSRKRTLAFEQLETKATPSSLLLVLAPASDAVHGAFERVEQVRAGEADSPSTGDTSSHWHFQITTLDLLRFVDEQTAVKDADHGVAPHPTPEDCQHVDVMMRLTNDALRSLVIADTLAHG